MGITPRTIAFNPPRAAESIYMTKEAQARRNLATINDMLSRATDPEAREGLKRRKAELEKELHKTDTKRQERARKMWHEVMEKRSRETREER